MVFFGHSGLNKIESVLVFDVAAVGHLPFRTFEKLSPDDVLLFFGRAERVHYEFGIVIQKDITHVEYYVSDHVSIIPLIFICL